MANSGTDFATLKYVTVAKALQRDINEKRYEPGDKLPPERALAKQFNVALLTVRQALKALEDKGLITREQGRGTFVADASRAPIGDRRLATPQQTVALLGLSPTPSANDNPANWEGLLTRYQGIVEAGFDYGIAIRNEALGDRADDADWLASRFSRNLGLIVHNDALSATTIRALWEAGLPIVQITHAGAEPVCDQVQIDVATGARAAVSHLLNLGHRRVATIIGDLSSPWNRLRYEGYQSALAAYQIPNDDALVVNDARGLQVDGAAAIRELLAIPEPPTALFCTDVRAFGVLSTMTDMGLAAPADLALVGYDDLQNSAYLGLSTIHNPIRESGTEAVRMLCDQLRRQRGAKDTPLNHPVTPYLVVRKSCGAA